jgi:hypothetical protein
MKKIRDTWHAPHMMALFLAQDLIADRPGNLFYVIDRVDEDRGYSVVIMSPRTIGVHWNAGRILARSA